MSVIFFRDRVYNLGVVAEGGGKVAWCCPASVHAKPGRCTCRQTVYSNRHTPSVNTPADNNLQTNQNDRSDQRSQTSAENGAAQTTESQLKCYLLLVKNIG